MLTITGLPWIFYWYDWLVFNTNFCSISVILWHVWFSMGVVKGTTWNEEANRNQIYFFI